MADQATARTLDSLALAHFLTGEVRRAVKIQSQAVDLIGNDDPELKAQLQAKLEKYRQAAKEEGLDE